MRACHVYILCSRSGVLNIGVTNDLERRVREHKLGLCDGFTKQYRVNRLVHSEEFNNVNEAIAREKQLKSWRWEKKVWRIERKNPQWMDLSQDQSDAATRDPATPLRSARDDTCGVDSPTVMPSGRSFPDVIPGNRSSRQVISRERSDSRDLERGGPRT